MKIINIKNDNGEQYNIEGLTPDEFGVLKLLCKDFLLAADDITTYNITAVGLPQYSEKRKETNRSITCSQDIRDRLKVMAAKKGVPMQAIVENSLLRMLDITGF